MGDDRDLSDCLNDTKISEPGSNYDDFSQKTRHLIKTGQFVLEGLDSNSANHLEKSASPELLKEVQDLPVYPAAENDIQNSTSFPSFELISKTAKLTGLKRRTAKIPEFRRKMNFLTVNNTNSVLDLATAQLNISCESETPQQISDTTGNEIFGETSLDFTLSQKIIDSQTTVAYLRKKELKPISENKMLFEEKNSEKLESIEVIRRIEEDNFEIVQESIDCMDGDFDDEMNIPILSPIISINVNDASDMETNRNLPKIEDENQNIKIETNEAFMKATVGKNSPKKGSQFAWYKDEETEKTMLWTRSEVNIPIIVEWNLKNGGNFKKKLKIKFIKWGKGISKEKAMHGNQNIVKKCQKHIFNETRIPHESFIYAKNVEPESIILPSFFERSKSGEDCGISGYYIEGSIPEEINAISFDLKFACQQMDFETSNKRMNMSLVFMLNDEKGNNLQTCFIDEVRIIAYPLRDFRNFMLDKKEGKYRKKYCKESKMSNLTNVNQNSFSDGMNFKKRKRTFREESNLNGEYAATCSKNVGYQTRLMLGMPTNTTNQMDFNDVRNENQQSIKKFRECEKRVHMIPVYEDNLLSFFEHGAGLSRRQRYDAASTSSFQCHPYSLQSQIRVDTNISIWLDTMNLRRLETVFRNSNIETVGQLLTHYQNEASIFEKLGIDPSDCSILHKTFLNFYYVYKYEELQSMNGFN